jgi:hypothetical protein
LILSFAPDNGETVRIDGPDADITTDIGADRPLKRMSLFAHCDPELPKTIADRVDGRVPSLHVMMMVWNVKATSEIEFVRVFLDTITKPRDRPGKRGTRDNSRRSHM